MLNAKVHVRNYSQKIKREYGIEDEEDEEDDDDVTPTKPAEKENK